MATWLYAWRWPIWLVYVLAWTAALLMPVPEMADANTHHLILDRRFLLAKVVHVGAYVVMAGLTAWLRAPVRYRFVLMFFLMAHATISEVLQDITDLGRTGALVDVAFDHFGIALGTFATWSWWAKE
jgi:VanZ family protein